jgi:phenylacetate-CoA ligase
MLDYLNRHIVKPLVAAKRQSKHLQFLEELERTQFDSAAVVRDRQLHMLQAQLRHAYETVPYYRKAWDAAGLHPSVVGTLDDLRDFPILTKADIRKHGLELRSEMYANAKLRLKTTSGSTGVPLKILLDERAAQWKTACTIRADQWSGYKLGQRVAKVWGNPEYRHFGLRGRVMNHFVDRAIYLDTIGLNEDRIREFATHLRRHQPGLLFGHAHSLYLLACALKKGNINDIRPNGIISTAMPLHDWQRVVIEEVFGTKACNRYGCEEVSLIASECPAHNGLHIAAESVFVEVQGDGPTGKLLITDLSNFAMPLIRYQIGDVATLSDQPCACGRGLPMIEKVEGRDADYVVTPAGQLISGISLTENFAMHIAGAAQVQIVQETRTELLVRMVADEQFTDTSRKQIAKLVFDTFGPSMKYEVELVDNIPQEPSGKYRFCISKVGTEFLKGLSA